MKVAVTLTFDLLTSQGCGIPMSDLSDSGLSARGQVDFPMPFVRGQVNFGARKKSKCKKYHYLIVDVLFCHIFASINVYNA